MRKALAFILASTFLIGLSVVVGAHGRGSFDKDKQKHFGKLIRKEDKEREKEMRREFRQRRHARVVRPRGLFRDNLGTRRSTLAHHQSLERLALRRHQMQERRSARFGGLSGPALAMHQREEWRRLQQHQREERLAIRQ